MKDAMKRKMDDEHGVPVTGMSKQELALLYSPDLTPHGAVNRLMRWVNRDPAFLAALERVGYRKHSKLLSPLQVGVFFEFLGEP